MKEEIRLNKYITDINEVVGLGFCVSKEHAKFMALRFNEAGIPSLALTDESKKEDRNNAKERLVNGEIKFIFVVDIYNEGVDIPEVNTIFIFKTNRKFNCILTTVRKRIKT